MSEKSSKLILAALIAGYVILFGTLTALRHFSFETQGWDMAVFEQVFWNAIHSGVMGSPMEEAPHHLGVHMSPFLYLLVPFFALFQSPYFLLFIQTLALALGAIPLYLLSCRVLQRRCIALLFAGAYLLYPSLHYLNWFDFHEIAFFVPLMLAAFYFIEAERWKLAVLFLLLAASIKEDAILAVAVVGVWLCITKTTPKERSIHEDGLAKFWTARRKRGVFLVCSMLLYFLVATKFIMSALGGGLLRLDRYAELGSTPLGIVTNLASEPSLFASTIFTPHKLSYAFWLFFPLAFVPLFAVRELLLVAPGLLENLLTTLTFQFSSLYQYDGILIPSLFVAALFGFQQLRNRFPAREKLFSYVVIGTALISFLLRSPISPFSFPVSYFTESPRRDAYRALVRVVPDTASVTAQTNLLPHLSNRKHAYLLGREPFPTDIVLIDGADPHGFKDDEAFQAYADSYALSGAYDVKVVAGRYFIFTKKMQ